MPSWTQRGAEHLAGLPNKRLRRYEVPLSGPDGVTWWMTEEFDTSEPIVPGLPDDYFADIVRAFLADSHGAEGRVGNAPSFLMGPRRSAPSPSTG